jgi:hypothetical protein
VAVISLPPKVYFEKVDKLQLLRSGVTLRSRYTGKRQVVNFPFAIWVLEGKLVPMEDADARLWRSFLVKLEGMKNTFRLPVPGSTAPSTGFTGNGTVGTGGVGARATSVTVDVTPSTAIVKEGDYFNIGDELKMATADATSGAGGAVVIPFQPATRKAYAAGQAVTFQAPFIYLAADSPESATWSLERPVRHGIKLICVEAVE